MNLQGFERYHQSQPTLWQAGCFDITRTGTWAGSTAHSILHLHTSFSELFSCFTSGCIPEAYAGWVFGWCWVWLKCTFCWQAIGSIPMSDSFKSISRGQFLAPPPPVRSLLIWLVRWRTHLRWGCLYPRSDRRVIGTKRIKDHGHRQVANWTMLNHKLTLSCPITTIGQCVCGENEARTGFRFVDAGVQHLLSIVPWCSNSNSVWFWKC